MTLRVKLILCVTLALFAACHVAAAYKMEASTGDPATDILSLNRD